MAIQTEVIEIDASKIATALSKPGPRIKPRPLFDIAPEFLAVLAELEATGGELDTEQGQKLEAWLNDVATEAGVKLDQYINAITMAEQDAAERKAAAACYQAEAARLMAGHNSSENLAKNLKKRMHDWMLLTDQQKIETPQGRKLTVCGNGGPAQLDMEYCSVKDPELKEFVIIVKAIDEAKLLAAIKAGREFENARLKIKGSHVRIT